jgi:hypothetical protein
MRPVNDPTAILARLGLPASLLLVVASAFSVYSVVRMAAESYDKVARMLGPLGRYWSARKTARAADAAATAELIARIDAMGRQIAEQATTIAGQANTIAEQGREIDWLRRMRDDNSWNIDMQRQIRELSATVRRLRDRAQITDAYLVTDEHWHRTVTLLIDPASCHIIDDIPAHESYLEFERRWYAEHADKPADPK